ncbi:MAG: TonB-dependent receptor [Burkholderiaceae bacterium]|nr:TonB-dependent receptor [Burkholderiaceae bacterium]
MKFPVRLSLAAAACGSLFSAFPLHAQTPPPTSAVVVVTAARVPQAEDQSPLDLRVIPRSRIEAAGADSLAALLQREAGLELAANGGPGQPVGLFLRGSNANHVVLLIDGVRVNSATTGTNAFEHLAPDQIERIEVLLGPASGLYGADAIGGVVQVFTRQADGLSLDLAAGSEATRRAAMRWGRADGATRMSLGASWQATDAGSATNADNAFSYNPDRDPYRNASGFAVLEHDRAPGHTVAARLTLADTRSHFDAGPGVDDFNRQRLGTLALESRDRLGAGWTSTLRLARGQDDLRTEGSFPGGFRTDQDQASWQHALALAGGDAVAGVEWRREQVDSDTAFTQTSRRVSSLFAGWSGHVAAGHRLQLALRHDDDSQFGGHGTGNLGWNWALAPGWRLSAAAGTAFKAPSFNDLYYPLQWGYQGNPDLAPERSRSAEIGLHHQAGAWRVDATAFDNRIRDLIAINDSFTSVANVGRARIRGLTLRTHWAAGPWAARAEATWQTPENVDTGADLVRRAHRFGSAGLDWRSGAWQAGAELVAVGARYNDAANTDALGGHGLVNLHARWAVTPHWALSARVDNLADRAYTQVRGYDTPGRRGVIALHWQMD